MLNSISIGQGYYSSTYFPFLMVFNSVLNLICAFDLASWISKRISLCEVFLIIWFRLLMMLPSFLSPFFSSFYLDIDIVFVRIGGEGGWVFLIGLWYVNWNIIALRSLIFSIWYRNLLQVWNLIPRNCSTHVCFFSGGFNGRGNCKQGARGVRAHAG